MEAYRSVEEISWIPHPAAQGGEDQTFDFRKRTRFERDLYVGQYSGRKASA